MKTFVLLLFCLLSVSLNASVGTHLVLHHSMQTSRVRPTTVHTIVVNKLPKTLSYTADSTSKAIQVSDTSLVIPSGEQTDVFSDTPAPVKQGFFGKLKGVFGNLEWYNLIIYAVSVLFAAKLLTSRRLILEVAIFLKMVYDFTDKNSEGGAKFSKEEIDKLAAQAGKVKDVALSFVKGTPLAKKLK